MDYFQDFLTRTPSEYSGVSTKELKALLDFECTEDDRKILVGEVSEEMIRKVLSGMVADKSSGPNGYTSEFFKAIRAITIGDFVHAVQSFLT